jgi:hypothetical protein
MSAVNLSIERRNGARSWVIALQQHLPSRVPVPLAKSVL